MNKLAFIDIDKTLADNFEREARARQFADSRFVPEAGIIPPIVYADAWKKIFYSERGLYNPEWVQLDTRIEGVDDALLTLDELGYKVIFLTSRPESMRVATEQWLSEHVMSVAGAEDILIMKAPPFQFTKTPVWKAGMVYTLFLLYQASEMIVVDDEMTNLDEIEKYITSPQCLGFTSLKEAVEALEGTL